MLSSKRFVTVCFILRPIMYFELIFIQVVSCRFVLFCFLLAYSCQVLTGSFVDKYSVHWITIVHWSINQLQIYVFIYFWIFYSVLFVQPYLSSISYCLDCYRIILFLKAWKSEFTNFFFQNCSDIQVPLTFHKSFRINLSIFKKYPVGIFQEDCIKL